MRWNKFLIFFSVCSKGLTATKQFEIFGGKIDIMSTGFSWIHNLLRQIGQGYANVCIGFLVLNGWTHATTIVQLEKIYELSLALCSPLNSKGFSVNQETRRVTCCYYVFNRMGWNPFSKIILCIFVFPRYRLSVNSCHRNVEIFIWFMAIIYFINWIAAVETIKGGNYSKEETIRERKLFVEIRCTH